MDAKEFNKQLDHFFPSFDVVYQDNVGYHTDNSDLVAPYKTFKRSKDGWVLAKEKEVEQPKP